MFLAVVLKIPVFFGLWLVWWAVHAEPELDDAPGEADHGFRRWRREPRKPRGPRRGPHGGAAAQRLPDCPPAGRVRIGRPAAPLTASASRRSSDAG